MSAFAARWKTKSVPAMAAVSAGRSRLSPRTSWKRGCCRAPSRKRIWPVLRLSQPVTVRPSASRRSTRLEPMKPAAPVTKTRSMGSRSDGQGPVAGLQYIADAEITEDERQEGQGEGGAADDTEVRVQLGEDLGHEVDVLATVELDVGGGEMPVPDPLGGELSGETVGRTALGRNHHDEPAGLLLHQAVQFVQAGWQIGQVFQNVNGEDPVEEAVGKIHPLLAVADHGAHAGETPADFFRHVFAELVAVITVFLFRGEPLVLEVFTQPGPDLKRRAKPRGRMAHG